jgi:Flp pilus assembly protein TadD
MNRKDRRAAAKQVRSGKTKHLGAAAAKVQEAIVLAQAGKYAEAETLLESARRIQPDDPELQHQLGMIYVRTGRSTEGQVLLLSAAEARPNEALYWSNLAAAYLSVEMSEQAIDAARRAVTLLPGYSEAWQNLAFGLRDLGRHAEAVDAFERAEAAGALAPASLASWGESYGLVGRFPDAERLVRRALDLAPGDPAILTLLGWVLVELHQADAAREAFRESLDVNPNQFLAAFNYGVLLLQTPDIAAALRWLRRATSIDIKSAAAWRVLALELARHGESVEALPAAERAARLNPDDKAVAKLLRRLKGEPEEGAEGTVFDFAAPVPIGPDAASGVAKRERETELGSGELDILELNTINFGED